MDERTGLTYIAQAAEQLSFDDVPGSVRAQAARVIADTIAVIMAGHRQPEMLALTGARNPLAQVEGAGVSQVLTPGLPLTTSAEAAFLNGTAGTFLELDEGVRPTGHPSIHVLPAALAAAQALHSSGSELLAAFLGGYEVTARLFATFRLRYPLHPHGHFGAVGAAVAVARLQHRSAVEPALIASAMPLLTVWAPCFEGATVRNVWSGVASAHGITANRLADAGFTGSNLAQAQAFGEMVGEEVDRTALNAPLDPAALRIMQDYVKFHSTCALAHSALDAVLSIDRVDPENILRIDVETVSNNLKINRQALNNQLSTRFSLPYAVAAALIHGHTRPEALVPADRVQRLASLVQVRVAKDLEHAWPARSPARVTIHLADRILTAQVDDAHGTFADPASPEELKRKFESLAWCSDAATQYEHLLHIEELPDAADIFRDYVMA